jgi:hypothetical protein
VVQDPEGILAAPQPGHIANLEFRRRLDSDADARAAFDRQVKEEQERRRKEREVTGTNDIAPLFSSSLLELT